MTLALLYRHQHSSSEGSVEQYYRIVSPCLTFIFSLSVTHCSFNYSFLWLLSPLPREGARDRESSFSQICAINYSFSVLCTYLLNLTHNMYFHLRTCRRWTRSAGNFTARKSKLKVRVKPKDTYLVFRYIF